MKSTPPWLWGFRSTGMCQCTCFSALAFAGACAVCCGFPPYPRQAGASPNAGAVKQRQASAPENSAFIELSDTIGTNCEDGGDRSQIGAEFNEWLGRRDGFH